MAEYTICMTVRDAEWAREVLEGRLQPAIHFRFFLGAMHWGPGALDQEIDQGAWCARALLRTAGLREGTAAASSFAVLLSN